MERRVRPARDAEADRAEAQRRAQRGAALAGSFRALRAAQHRLAAEHAGRIPQLRRGADEIVERRGEGRQYQVGLNVYVIWDMLRHGLASPLPWGEVGARSAPGEGKLTNESHLPPHRNPLPQGERRYFKGA